MPPGSSFLGGSIAGRNKGSAAVNCVSITNSLVVCSAAAEDLQAASRGGVKSDCVSVATIVCTVNALGATAGPADCVCIAMTMLNSLAAEAAAAADCVSVLGTLVCTA